MDKKKIEGVTERMDILSQSEIVSLGSEKSIQTSAALAMTRADFQPLADDYAVACKLSKQVALAFVTKAYDVALGHVELGRKYLILCQDIRDHKIGPAQVALMLSGMGFHKVRISEINKIATVPDELWNKFAARELGMKKVLQIARGSTAVDMLQLDASELKEAGLASSDERKDLNPGEKGTVPQETHAIKVAKAVKALQALCGKNHDKFKRLKTFDKHSSGIVITIQYHPAVNQGVKEGGKAK